MPDTIATTPAPSTSESTPPAQPSQPSAVDWTPYVPKGAEKVFESYKGKSLGDIFESHVAAQKMMGDSIRLPKADAKPEDVKRAKDDIYNKLGRPESPDKYDLGELPVINDRFQWDEARLKDAKTTLHGLGLNNDQAKAVMGLFAKEVSAYFPDNVKEAAASKESLIQHYGSEAMYERNIGFAHKAVKEFGDEETVKWLDESGVGNSPAFVKLMAKLGKELMEHGAVEPSSDVDYISPAEAQKRIDAIMADINDLYWKPARTPGKETRVKEVEELFKIVAGEV